MPRTLYICYFGLREPLVQTQVLPYLLEIVKGGTDISLLTFEPEPRRNWTKEQIKTERRSLEQKGINWHYLHYHKSPSIPATFYDIVNGARTIRQLHKLEKFDILHCRVHVPMLMAALARKLSSEKPKLLFDIRGFFPEEYTDAGVWPVNGWLYRLVKRVEKWLLREADGFVVLTRRAREILFPEIVTEESLPAADEQGRPVEIIPCCVDLERFGSVSDRKRAEIRKKLLIEQRFVIAYVGSFGGWYLSDELFDFFAAARQCDPSVFALILTQRHTDVAEQRLLAKSFSRSDFFIASVSPTEIAGYLNAADCGVSFIKRCYSKLASSPTKNAEYLAAGLPLIANSGIGDVDWLIEDERVGVMIESFSRDGYVDGLERIKALGDIRNRCMRVAKDRFDLETVGGVRYRRLYAKLIAK